MINLTWDKHRISKSSSREITSCRGQRGGRSPVVSVQGEDLSGREVDSSITSSNKQSLQIRIIIFLHFFIRRKNLRKYSKRGSLLHIQQMDHRKTVSFLLPKGLRLFRTVTPSLSTNCEQAWSNLFSLRSGNRVIFPVREYWLTLW